MAKDFDRMLADAERSVARHGRVSISAHNYGLLASEAAKFLRDSGKFGAVRNEGFMGYLDIHARVTAGPRTK